MSSKLFGNSRIVVPKGKFGIDCNLHKNGSHTNLSRWKSLFPLER